MNKTLIRATRIFLIALVLIVGIGAGVVLDRQTLTANAQTPDPATPNFALITEAWNLIQKHYVDRDAIQPTPLTYAAITGMVNALGDTGHTSFMTPAMTKSQQNYMQGQFEGIGAQVEYKDGHLVIVAPFDNSPAQRAGLHAGDVVMKVDGQDMTGLTQEQIISKILGPAGTNVTITIFDPSINKTFDVTITRAKIVMNNVTWQKLPGTNIGHLRLAGFSQGVSRDIRQALTDMQAQGVTSVIFDLRNNPGGLLSEAINTASQFLSSGDVLLEKDAQGTITHVNIRSGGVATNLPVVVLINRGSASASEIVAGALQDAARANLVGDTTFGTGTVLTQFSLSDGSAMMIAIQEWLTPNGRVIWHKGITPDVSIALPTNASPLTPEGERTLTKDQLAASNDTQLLKAISLLVQSANTTPVNESFNTAIDLPNSLLAFEPSLLNQIEMI